MAVVSPGLSAPSLPGFGPVLTEGWYWGYSPTGDIVAHWPSFIQGEGELG